VNATRNPELNPDMRAQAFMERIAPLSADLAGHGRTRALALKKLRRLCQAEVRRLKTNYTRPPSSSTSPSTATPSARSTPTIWSCALGKCAPASASATLRSIRRKPGELMPLITKASTAINPASSRSTRRPSSRKALDLLSSDRYLEKGMCLMALTGRRPAEIFFSASFSLPKKKLPYPRLRRPAQNP
jgi:hypothetical protein